MPASTDYGRPMKPFFFEIQNFCADKFLDIWFIFGRTISTHFGTVIPLTMFSIIPTKIQAFISTSQIFIWDWDLNLGRKEVGIQLSCVRSPCPLLFDFASKVRCGVRVLNLNPNPSYALLLICMMLNFRPIRSQYFIPVKFDKYELFGYDCIIEM